MTLHMIISIAEACLSNMLPKESETPSRSFSLSGSKGQSSQVTVYLSLEVFKQLHGFLACHKGQLQQTRS